jgi:outer membrane lipoprotein LolB
MSQLMPAASTLIRYRTTLVISAIIWLLCACASTPQIPNQDNPQTVWTEHQQQIATLNNWHIIGKLGIRTPTQTRSARLNWQQQQQYVDIRLSTLLGQSVATLKGTNNHLQIKLAGRGEFNTSEPSALLSRELGWTLPIDMLHYWVRGIPSPQHQAHYQLNEQGLINTLQQHHWQLSFSHYQTLDSQTLPGKIRLQQGDITLTLVIKRWITNP